MERRQLLYGMGVAAIASGARMAAGQMKDMPGMSSGPAKHQGLMDSAAKCSSTAEACTTHCIEMLAAGDKTMLACAANCRELAVVCNGLFSLAAQDAPSLAKYAKLTSEVCAACEAECKKFPNHQPCVVCAEACAACEAECKKLTK